MPSTSLIQKNRTLVSVYLILEPLSENSISDAEDFLKVCINYLKNRGVTL